jgi:hypothetical protein
MTQRKPRDVTIHASRIHISIGVGFEEPLRELLGYLSLFDDADYPAILADISVTYHVRITGRIGAAYQKHDMDKKTNPDRFILRTLQNLCPRERCFAKKRGWKYAV